LIDAKWQGTYTGGSKSVTVDENSATYKDEESEDEPLTMPGISTEAGGKI
jgi:hypothetical protein